MVIYNYDGNVWKELQDIDGIPFLSIPHNYCFTMNVDWFNPYDRTEYSVGAIYLVIQNLPRSERYKFENVILVGMIPGPKEPKRDMNSYLSPLVTELNQLFQGVNSSSGCIIVRALLSCVASDLPATCKVCGFLSYNAKKGCSKCLKEFPTRTFGEKPDYSGYDYEKWTVRKSSRHMLEAMRSKGAKTASERSKIEQESGARFSELHLF